MLLSVEAPCGIFPVASMPGHSRVLQAPIIEPVEIAMKMLAALAWLVAVLVMACATETSPASAQSSGVAGQGGDAAAKTAPTEALELAATPPGLPANTVAPTGSPVLTATAEPPPQPTATPNSAAEPSPATATPVPSFAGAQPASDEWPKVQTPAPPADIEYYTTENLVTMASGLSHSCGLRADGTAVCWGEDRYGQASGPIGSFTAITAFSRYSCGARPEGGLSAGASGRRFPNRNNWLSPLKFTQP